ncbi:MAG: prolipoprotein diacylglyceryl transferase [Alphaproteobacteria bacterium]
MENQIWIHDLDPIMLSIGPVDIRWYAMAYIVGLLVGWRLAMRMADRSPMAITPDHLDRFLTWAVVGVIVGGRLGAFLFYRPQVFFDDPAQILRVWEGGMSFHGGLLGVMVAMLLFARTNKVPLFSLTDIVCAVAPFGIMLGRVANFINGEHWGRVTDVSWAIAFPRSGDLMPRHPSQLYECALEGALLFAVLMVVTFRGNGLGRPGLLSGVFLVGYALARMTGEIFREPEVLTQSLPFGTTWGQWLSLPMLLGGLYLIRLAMRRDRVTA